MTNDPAEKRKPRMAHQIKGDSEFSDLSDRLTTMDSGRCRGSSIHPTNLCRRDGRGVSETTASVSSSFRRGRGGMGDFGIAFLPGGERSGKLGR